MADEELDRLKKQLGILNAELGKLESGQDHNASYLAERIPKVKEEISQIKQRIETLEKIRRSRSDLADLYQMNYRPEHTPARRRRRTG